MKTKLLSKNAFRSAIAMIGLLLFSASWVNAQTNPVALKATGGKGQYRENIYWLMWDMNDDGQINDKIYNGMTREFTAPSSKIKYTVKINNIKYYANTDEQLTGTPSTTTGNNKRLRSFEYNDWVGNSFMHYYNWGDQNCAPYGAQIPKFANWYLGGSASYTGNTLCKKPTALKVNKVQVTFSISIKAVRILDTGQEEIVPNSDFAFIIAGSESVDNVKERYGLGVAKRNTNAVLVPVEFFKGNNPNETNFRLQLNKWEGARELTNFDETTTENVDIREIYMKTVNGADTGDAMFAATKTNEVFVRLSGGGAQHISLGVLDLVDMGDAPNSYEETTNPLKFAQHIAKPSLKRENELKFDASNTPIIIQGQPNSTENKALLSSLDKPAVGIGDKLDSEAHKGNLHEDTNGNVDYTQLGANFDADDGTDVNTDDEDGIPNDVWVKGKPLRVNVHNYTDKDAYLYVWVDVADPNGAIVKNGDLYGDGHFTASYERLDRITIEAGFDGTKLINLGMAIQPPTGNFFEPDDYSKIRVRLRASTEKHLNVNGVAVTGEIEDHIITVEPKVIKLFGDVEDVTCGGENNGKIFNLSVHNGEEPYTFLWNDGSNAQRRENLEPGTYTVTVLDKFGAKATKTFVVEGPTDADIVKLKAEDIVGTACGSSNGTANLTATHKGKIRLDTEEKEVEANAKTLFENLEAGYHHGYFTSEVIYKDPKPIGTNPMGAKASDEYGCSYNDPQLINHQGIHTHTSSQPNSTDTALENNAGAAFDNDEKTAWSSKDAVTTGWLQYAFNKPTKIFGYTLLVKGGTETDAKDCRFSSTADNAPNNFKFEGSADGTTWVTLDTQAGQKDAIFGTKKQYDLYVGKDAEWLDANVPEYKYYRLKVEGVAGNYIKINEMQLLRRQRTGGCETEVEFNVPNLDSNLSATVSYEDIKCFDEKTTATINVTGVAPTQNEGAHDLEFTIIATDGGSTAGDAAGTITGQRVKTVTQKATELTLTDLTEGHYQVKIKDKYNGCDYTLFFDVDKPTQMVATVSTTNIKCNTEANGTIIVDVTGGIPPYKYSKDGGTTKQDENIFKDLPAGNYTITVLDANECKIEKTATIADATALSVTLAGTDPTCDGVNNGKVVPTVSGGTAPYRYVWYDNELVNGSTDEQLSNVPGGTYKVRITDANGCTATAETTLNEPTEIVLSLGTPTPASCGASTGEMEVQSNLAGKLKLKSVTPNQEQAVTANGKVKFENLTAGHYVALFIADGTNCEKEIHFNILSEESELKTLVRYDDINCFGGTTEAIVKVTGAKGKVKYTLTGTNGGATEAPVEEPNAIEIIHTFTGLTKGHYTVEVKDLYNECTYVSEFDIDEPTEIVLTKASQQNVLCKGEANGSVIVNATGGITPYKYSIDGGAEQTSNEFTGLTAGEHTITVKDNGTGTCEKTLKVTIKEPTADLTVQTTVTQATCNGANNGKIEATVTGGTPPYTYEWSNGSTDKILTGLSDGTYTVTVTDANGCTKQSQNATLTEPTATTLTVNEITPTECNSKVGKVKLTASADGKITINGTTHTDVAVTVGTEKEFAGLAAGHYVAVFTDNTANACPVEIHFDIANGNSNLKATVTYEDIKCNGGTTNATVNVTGLNASATSVAYTLVGTNGGTATANGTETPANQESSHEFTNLTAGHYAVTVTDTPNSCTYTVEFEIDQPASALQAEKVESGNVKCNGGTDGYARVQVLGGTAPYSYVWKKDGTPVAGKDKALATGLGAGTYTVEITDANNCDVVKVENIKITEPTDALAITENITKAKCHNGTNAGIVITVTGGTEPYSYEWSNGVFTKDLADVTAGTYTVIVTDKNGCTVEGTYTIDATDAITLTINEVTPTQCNAKVGKVKLTASANGTVKLTLNGADVAGKSKTVTAATEVEFDELGEGYYIAEYSNNNGCVVKQGFNINDDQANIKVTVVVEEISCNQDTAKATATVTGGTAPYKYSIDGGTEQDNGVFTALTAGNHDIVVTDVNGCTSHKSFFVEPRTPLVAQISNFENAKCSGSATGKASVDVTGGTPPYTYKWTDASNTEVGTDVLVENLKKGTYTVTVTDAKNCTTTTTVSIDDKSELTATATAVAVTCSGANNGTATVTAQGGQEPYTYLWNNGSTDKTVTGLAGGAYTVTVTDVNGCTTTANVTVDEPTTALTLELVGTPTPTACNAKVGKVTLKANADGTIKVGTQMKNVTAGTDTEFTGLAAGHYVAVFTNLGATCTQEVHFDIVNNNSSLTASVTYEDITCFGKTTTATIKVKGLNVDTKKVKYELVGVNGGLATAEGTETPANQESSHEFANLTAGHYTVKVTDEHNGCTYTVEFDIDQPATALQATLVESGNVKCNGGTDGYARVQVLGGTAPYTYVWKKDGAVVGGKDKALATGLGAGTYVVEVTDAKSCDVVKVENIVINEPTALVIGATPTIVEPTCYQSADASIDITVSGGTKPYTFVWSNGLSTKNIANVTAGTYKVTVTDANGCTAEGTYEIKPKSEITLEVVGAPTPTECNTKVGKVTLKSNEEGTIKVGDQIENVTAGEEKEFTGLGAGHYVAVFTKKDTNCTQEVHFDIVNNNSSLTASVTYEDITCFGKTTTATIKVKGLNVDTNSVKYELVGINGGLATAEGTETPANQESSHTFANLTAGHYTVKVTDEHNGCTYTVEFEIDQPASTLQATLVESGNVKCNGGADGFARVQVLGGTSPYAYVWKKDGTAVAGQDKALATGLGAGTYVVEVTDAKGCEVVKVENIVITEPTKLEIGATPTIVEPTCYQSSDASIDITVTGGTEPYTYKWSNGVFTEDLTNVIAGTYTVIVTDKNGCTVEKEYTIDDKPAITLIVNEITPTECNSKVGKVKLTASAEGIIKLTLDGKEVAGKSKTGTVVEFDELAEGHYVAVVTTTAGCTAKVHFDIINKNSNLNATVAYEDVSCSKGTTTATVTVTGATGSVKYVLTGGNLSAPIEQTDNGVFTGLTAGHYQVTISDENTCKITRNFDIDQSTGIIAEIVSVANVGCKGGNDGAVRVRPNGGTTPYTYTWTKDGVTISQTTSEITGLEAGVYEVTVTDANGCTAIVSKEITEPKTKVTITDESSVANFSCNGTGDGSIHLVVEGGTPPYSYLWSNGSTDRDIYHIPTGKYTVTVTDANGCTDTEEFDVTQPTELTLKVDEITPTQCNASVGKVKLTANEAGKIEVNGVVKNVKSGETVEFDNLPAGHYEATFTVNGGCVVVEHFNITNSNSNLFATIKTKDVTCNGKNDGYVKITPIGGTPFDGGKYKFFFNEGEGELLTVFERNDLTKGNHIIRMVDENGCSYHLSFDIDEPTELTLSESFKQNVKCKGEANGLVVMYATGGTMPYTYSLENGAGVVTNNKIEGLKAGDYVVKVTDKNGCTATLPIHIDEPKDALSVELVDVVKPTCHNGNDASIEVVAKGGTAPYYYTWSNGSVGEKAIGLTAGTYMVTVTDANGCTIAKENIEVEATKIDEFSVEVIQSANCSTLGKVSLKASAEGQVLIDGTYVAVQANTPKEVSLSAGDYQAKFISSKGCELDLVSFTIEDKGARVEATTTVTDLGCDYKPIGKIVIEGKGGVAPYTYSINGLPAVDKGVFENLSAGTYIIDITDANGCTGKHTVEVTEPERTGDCDGDGVSNQQEIYDGTNPEDPCDYNPAHQDITKVTDAWKGLDCDEDGVTNGQEIINGTDPLNPCGYSEKEIDGRRGFSPNGDGKNDMFKIKGIENCYPEFRLRVYDRWGGLVFDSEEGNRKGGKWWDGYSNNKKDVLGKNKVPVGTYFYVLEFDKNKISRKSDNVRQGWVYVNY